MLAKLFSFHGRMTRLEYLGWTIVSLVIVAIITAVLMFAGLMAAIGLHAGKGQAFAAGLVVGVPMLVIAVWSGFAITAKRVRDMGLSPLLVIGALIVFDIIDLLVLKRLTPVRFYWPLAEHTMAGGIVNIAYLAALLLWPGQGDDAGPRSPADDLPLLTIQPTIRPDAPRGAFGMRAR